MGALTGSALLYFGHILQVLPRAEHVVPRVNSGITCRRACILKLIELTADVFAINNFVLVSLNANPGWRRFTTRNNQVRYLASREYAQADKHDPLPSTSPVQVRDHMYRAIQDYLCSERCEWMQKWPGMCVLNASQLHWTLETEELLLEKAGEAPAAMLTRQVFCRNISRWATKATELNRHTTRMKIRGSVVS